MAVCVNFVLFLSIGLNNRDELPKYWPTYDDMAVCMYFVLSAIYRAKQQG
jgi:hypothetical protein